MVRRHAAAGMDSFEDLARKVAILERELALQRQALDKLKAMGPAPKRVPETLVPARKSA
jgi:hypothetical protein